MTGCMFVFGEVTNEEAIYEALVNNKTLEKLCLNVSTILL